MQPSRKIALLIADVDGTLVTADKTLTDAAKQAVRDLRAAGIKFVVTSGRPPRGMAMLVQPLALDRCIAGFNGGVFARPDLSIIEQRLLDPAVVRETMTLLRDRGIGVWLYTAVDWLIADANAPHVAKEASTVQFPPTVVSDLDNHVEGIAKIVGVCDDQDLMRRCESEVQAALHGRASATCSQPYYLDVTHQDANKGAVVDYMSRLFNVPAGEIATIGDSANDVLMFKRSGVSIAMGNASADVQKQATCTTDTNQNDGFAKAVRRFILT